MTNVNSSLRPDINSILNDEKNFDELYKRFMSINKHKCLLTNYHNIPKDFINTDIKIELYEKGMIKIKLNNRCI